MAFAAAGAGQVDSDLSDEDSSDDDYLPGVAAPLLAAVAREGGARSLFAGWAPRAARAAPTCGIVLVAYEMAKGGA